MPTIHRSPDPCEGVLYVDLEDQAASVTDNKGGLLRPARRQIARPDRTSQTSAQLDSPQSTAKVVAAILDGAPMPEERDLPLAFREIARIRSAARRILEAKLSPAEEDRLLGAVARRATRAELHEWAEEALILEIRGPDLENVDHSVTTAHERLRRASYESCPICLSRVLSETELEDRKRREKWAELDLARWEGAVR